MLESVEFAIRAGQKLFLFETGDMYRIREIGEYGRSKGYRVYTLLMPDDWLKVRDEVRRKYLAGEEVIFLVTVSRNYIDEIFVKKAHLVSLPISTPAERRKVMEEVVERLRDRVRDEIQITETHVRLSKGLYLDDLEKAVRESIERYVEIKPEVFRDMKIQYLRKYGIEYIEPRYSFEHVGGNEELKKYVRERVEVYFKHPEIAKKFGLRAPRGMLLAGVGGVGKTWFAVALAGELSMPVVKFNVADFISRSEGESEVRLRHILRLIDSLAPLVVFMDEIDQIGMKREYLVQAGSIARRSVINILMEWLSKPEKEVFIVGATNLIHQMDENFIRSGRFDVVMYVPPPDRKEREEILKIHAQKLHAPEGVEFEEGVFSKIAEETELWVGADLGGLVNKALEHAMIDYLHNGCCTVKYEHFRRAKNEIRPNLEIRKASLRKTIEAMKMLPQGSVVKAPIEKTEIMINIGKRKKLELQKGIRM